jgi:hypothetical protein
MNFFVKGFAIDSQDFGGLALVAAGFFQDIDNMLFLDIFQCPRRSAPNLHVQGKM